MLLSSSSSSSDRWIESHRDIDCRESQVQAQFVLPKIHGPEDTGGVVIERGDDYD